jgi:hypothetical protein
MEFETRSKVWLFHASHPHFDAFLECFQDFQGLELLVVVFGYKPCFHWDKGHKDHFEFAEIAEKPILVRNDRDEAVSPPWPGFKKVLQYKLARGPQRIAPHVVFANRRRTDPSEHGDIEAMDGVEVFYRLFG